MEKINIEISSEYRETIDFLKQVLAGKDGNAVKDDNELIEIMITGFMDMIQQEMGAHNHEEGDSCGCGHSH
ncbi:MAG: hypothetical protein PHE25_02755 [Candidatus Gracilibacteria bacterium]|nr:hypothetical protein [Candidatus Gracilibacteria bacterium]